jgi:flagellar motor switch protein FliM
MSDKVLTQDEINALLSAVGDKGGPSAESKVVTPDLETFDDQALFVVRNVYPVLKARSLNKDVHSALSFINETFAQNCGSSMSASLRSQIQIKFEGMEQVSYGEFATGLPEPSSVWGFELQPLGLQAALCMEPGIVHSFVDLLMGGSGTVPVMPRGITELDQSVVETAVRLLIRELKLAWERMIEFEPQISRRETRPGLLQIYGSSEPMVQIEMSLKLGPNQGQVFLGLPGQLMKTLRSKVETQTQVRTRQGIEDAVNRVKNLLLHVPALAEARITGTRLRVSDLLALKEGDVIRLDQRVQKPVEVAVNGRPKFHGLVVVSHDKKAFQIV